MGRPGPALFDDDLIDVLGALDAAVALLRRVGDADVRVTTSGVAVQLDAETWLQLRALSGRGARGVTP